MDQSATNNIFFEHATIKSGLTQFSGPEKGDFTPTFTNFFLKETHIFFFLI